MKEDSMTLTARLVLEDCRLALGHLENEPDERNWRVHWVAAVTLLRIVGHVLDKVDGRENAQLRLTARKLYKEWKTHPEHEIFREFIDNERNNVLKEYEFGVSEGPIEVLLSEETPSGPVPIQVVQISENIYRPMQDGVYAGEDGRTLIEDSIEWWERQLSQIEQSLKIATSKA
jgi:hypothetical protein